MPLSLKETPQGILIGDVEFVWARNAKEFFFSNSIVVHSTDALVVDPSANFSFFERLAAQNIVKTVVNTHYHIDHRSLNHLFTNAQFFCHEKDKAAIQSFDNYLKYADQNQDSSYVMWLKGIFSSLEINREVIHETLKDDDFLPVKGIKMQALHLPGHTPGHLGFYFEDLKTLYVSDIDLTPTGPWYANVSSNIDQFIDSIQRIKNFSADYYITSHGERVYEPEKFLEKLNRFELAFEKRDQRILENLHQNPQNLEQLSKIGIVYKSSMLNDPLRSCFERQMVEKHLERLQSQNKIRFDHGVWMLSDH